MVDVKLQVPCRRHFLAPAVINPSASIKNLVKILPGTSVRRPATIHGEAVVKNMLRILMLDWHAMLETLTSAYHTSVTIAGVIKIDIYFSLFEL